MDNKFDEVCDVRSILAGFGVLSGWTWGVISFGTSEPIIRVEGIHPPTGRVPYATAVLYLLILKGFGSRQREA